MFSHLKASHLKTAIYNTIHNYKFSGMEGAVAMAARANMKSPGYLSNKANPENDAQLGLEESVTVQLVADDYQIADAYCLTLGGVFIRYPDLKFVSDQHLLDIWAKNAEADGHTAKVMRESLEDGDINDKEMIKLEASINEGIRTKLELLDRLKNMHQQGKESKR